MVGANGGSGSIERFVEVGPGKVLTGLGKRIERQAQWTALTKPEALDTLAAKS